MSYTHDEVAHNWANETGRKRRGFNMFYEDNADGSSTIYSYGHHFPIATILTAPNGERVVLFTTRSYSISTSKHLTITRRALGYNNDAVLYVPEVEPYGSSFDAKRIRQMILDKLPEIALKAKRARKYTHSHITDMRSKLWTVNRINECWELGHDDVSMPDDLDQFVADYEAAEKRKREQQKLRDREAIRDWLKGETDRAPHTRTPFVRVKGDLVETSWGIRVPLKEALPLYHLSRLCRKCDNTFTPMKSHMVGGWRLDKIDASGTLKAGCHIIPFKVQHEAAKLAGLARA